MANKEYEMAIKIVGEIERSFYNAMRTTKQEIGQISKGTTSFKGAISAASGELGKFDGIAQKAFNGIKIAATAAATAVGGIIAGSIKVGAAFEEQMSTVEAISGASKSDMEALSAKAKQMGATTAFSATEAGKAMEYMGMAGWKTKEMLGGIDGVMNLAAASGEDLGKTSDIVTDALTAFNMRADEATHFADILAAASSNSNTNVGMMGETFKYVAPVAGSLGYSAEDTAFAIGLMANSGIKASQSGTALRSMFSNLVAPTDNMAIAMERYGISAINSDGSMKTLKETLDHLREKMKSLSEEEQASIVQTIAGKDADKMAKEAMSELSEEEIYYQTALGKGLELIKEYDEEQLNSALISTHKREELEKMTEEQKRNMVALEQGDIALRGMSKSEQAATSKNIFGKNAMSGALAIINASEEDYKRLYEEIQNCDGAAKEMAETRLDNLNGDVTLLKSGMEGLGVQIYEQMSPILRQGVQWATEGISNLSKAFTTHFPTVVREIKNFTGAFKEFAAPLFSVGKFLISNPDIIVSTLVGIGTVLGTYKIASGLLNIAQSLLSLNTASLAIAGAGAAIGVIAGIIAQVKLADRELKNQNLAEHFGDITLSMEELHSVARHIVGEETLEKLNESLTSFSNVEEISNNLQNTIKDINKSNWKLSIGLELSESETLNYQEGIKNFIQDSKEMLAEDQYAMTIGMDMFTNDDKTGKNIRKKMNNFYKGLNKDLEKASKELAEYTAKAFSDGILSFDESEIVQGLMEKVTNITEQLSAAKFEAKISRLSLQYEGGDLTAESFQNLQAENQELVKAATADADEVYENMVAQYYVAHQAGAMTSEEYNDALQQAKINRLDKITEAESRVARFSADTIMKQYEPELKTAIPEFQSLTSEKLSEAMESLSIDGAPVVSIWEGLVQELQKSDALDSVAKDNINGLYEMFKPSMEGLQKARDEYVKMGQEIPTWIQEGINQMAQLGAVSGDVDAIWEVIATEARNNPQFMALLKEMEAAGLQIPPEVARGIQGNTEVVQGEVSSFYDKVKNFANSIFGKGFHVTAPLSISLNAQVKTSVVNAANFLEQQVLKGYAKGGIITKPTIATFAEDGPEAAIPLDGSQRAISLWQEAGTRLGVLKAEKLSDSNSFSNITNRIEKAQQTTTNHVTNAQNATSNAPVFQFNFYGEAPSKQDMIAATETAQEKWAEWVEQQSKKAARVSFV